jgi:hypothetical protein
VFWTKGRESEGARCEALRDGEAVGNENSSHSSPKANDLPIAEPDVATR